MVWVIVLSIVQMVPVPAQWDTFSNTTYASEAICHETANDTSFRREVDEYQKLLMQKAHVIELSKGLPLMVTANCVALKDQRRI